MKTSLVITGVKVITMAGKEGVVFETTQGGIFRNPQQALIDMQNSGRVFGNMHPFAPQAQRAYHEVVGATLTGDVTFFKAGEEYEVRPDSAVITNAKHPEFGKWKVGDKRPATVDGSRVEGFLYIPETPMEKMVRKQAEAMADMYAQSLGINVGYGATPVAQESFGQLPEETPEDELQGAITGKAAKGK